jgi:hypothetical protein
MTGRDQRQDAVRQFRELQNRGDLLFSGSERNLISIRPTPDRWSILDCFIHLNLTVRQFRPLIKAGFEAGAALEARDDDQPYSLSLIEKSFLWVLEPPYRWQTKTKAEFMPDDAIPGLVKAEFDTLHHWLGEKVVGAGRIPLDRVKLESPFDERVKYSLWASFLVIAAHARRHLWQAEQVATLIRVR